MKSKANVFVISLGCDKNRVDAEIMASKIKEGGYNVCNSLNRADIVIINTCGFIQSAKEEAIDLIFDMIVERNSDETRLSKIIVTGCLVQRYTDEIADLIPELDAYVCLGANADIVEILDNVMIDMRVIKHADVCNLPLEGKRLLSTPKHYAYLKIAEGCSNHCTYCAIPGIRGPYRSRRPENIIKEAKKLVKGGVKQLFLIAQDTSSYGRDFNDGTNLSSLLRSLCEIDGIWKITLLYVYPERIDDELLDVIASNDKIAKYLDIPLQHCSGSVLKRMGRFGNRDELLALIKHIREKIPGVTLRSTFMIGFPGETDDDFRQLQGFMSAVHFNRSGCFIFSCEDGTPAEHLDGQIDETVKNFRFSEFNFQNNMIMELEQHSKIGTVMEGICDGYDESRFAFICRPESDIPESDTVVYYYSQYPVEPGDIVKMKILTTDSECDLDLVAEPYYEPEPESEENA